MGAWGGCSPRASHRCVSNWLEIYLSLRPVGELREAPFVMKIATRREPDLQVILNEHLDRLYPTYLEGAADLVIEVVSEESTTRDYGEKFAEDEAAGVAEYWIIDPLRQEAHFYSLSADRRYTRRVADAEGQYTSRVLPDLRLPVGLLWANPLPAPLEIGELIKKSLP